MSLCLNAYHLQFLSTVYISLAYLYTKLILLLLLSGDLPPPHPVPNILFCHTNALHVLLLLHPWIFSVVFHFSSRLASPFHPSIPPLLMSEPSQPFLSNFAFKALRVAPVMYSFLILSILVTPNKNINIFSSASYLFVSATISGSQQGHSSPSTPPCIHCLIHHSCVCCFGWMIPGI